MFSTDHFDEDLVEAVDSVAAVDSVVGVRHVVTVVVTSQLFTITLCL